MESREQMDRPSSVPVPAGPTTSQDPSLVYLIVRAFVSYIVLAVLQAAMLFGSHEWHWLRGWLLVGFLVFVALSNVSMMVFVNPQLLRKRFEKHAGTKSYDVVVSRLYVVLLLTFFYIAGLDAGGRSWSSLDLRLVLPGLVLSLLGHSLVLWTMAENRHLEATVRIQEDHTAVTTGPYGFIRHPMYVGGMVTMAGWPLIVGSFWAYVPVAGVVVLFTVRTVLEDRTLQEQLPGYRDYCRQTRDRLVPGIS